MPRPAQLVLKALRWLLLGLAALLLLATAALLAANWRDDPLRPEIAPLMRFDPPAPEAMRRNGYFTLLGLGAPAGADSAAAGQRFFTAQLQGYELYRRTGEIKSTVRQAYPQRSVDMQAIRCAAEQDDCVARHRQSAAAIRAVLTQQAPLIERYLSLQDAPEYEEVIPPYIGLDLPRYQDAVAASELVGMHAALLLDDGRRTEALTLLQRNARIHQRLMSGARTLIGAMIALAMDMRQLRLVSSLLRHHPELATDHAAEIEHLLANQMPLAPALAGEMKWTLAAHGMVASGPSLGLGQPYPDASWHEKIGHHATWPLFKLAYLPNASLNHVYADLETTVALSRLPADQLQAQADQALQEHQQSLHGGGLLPFRLRNLWGNVLLAMSGPDLYLSYIERAHDVEGYRRLLRLQLAALKDGIAPAQMPAWLATQAAALRNPYTLAPMGWEPTTQSLVFAGRQPQTQNPGRSSTYRVRVFSAGAPFPRVSR